VPDAGPSYDQDGGQRRPGDHARSAGQAHPAGHGTARPVREYRKSRADRAGSSADHPWPHDRPAAHHPGDPCRAGPAAVAGRPYGPVPWVLNARAAGQVRLRRGRDRHDYTLRQLPAAQAGPILRRYLRIAPATRPYFQASKDSPVADFIAEADRHPVFALALLSQASAGDTAQASRP
jgi:hypothetical protein